MAGPCFVSWLTLFACLNRSLSMDEIRIAFVCFGPKYFLCIRYFNAVRTCQYWVFCQLLPKSCCFIAFKMFFLEFKRWCLQNDIKLLNMSLKFPFSSPFQCLKYHRVKQTEGHDAIEWKMGELVLRGRGNFQSSSFQTTPQWMLFSTVDVAFPSQF